MHKSYGRQIRSRRVEAGISGVVLCMWAGIGRSRLSNIERGNVVPSDEILKRIDMALSHLIRVKERVDALAAQEGWPLALSGPR
ncbi:MAG: helix-turn-helix domain-containing protein [Bryobacteraceae bacterium]